MTRALELGQPPRRRRSSGVVRHRRGKAPRPLLDAGRFLLVAIAVLVASSLAIAGALVWTTTSHIKPGVPLLQANGQAAALPQVGALQGGANILLAGTDTRTGQGGEFSTPDQLAGSSGVGSNDVTMVLHISADHSSAAVVSIPRDLEVPIPACPDPSGGTFSAQSKAMFNTTLSEGGLSCVVLTAEQLTGLSIQYAATINFDGVIAMADAVGGVSVCLNAPVVDPSAGLDLPAGVQKLSGATALGFVRTRYGVGDGSDLGRISNQQVFLSALVRQVMGEGVLSNPIVLYQLANAAAANVQASESLANPTTMVSLALALKNISLANIVFLQYPAVADPQNSNRVVPNDAAANALITALAADNPLQLTGSLGVGAADGPALPAPLPSATPSVADLLRNPVATASPVAAAAPATPVALPSSITGQTAAQSTCSKANN
jgi:LCP family protein required for cell wall assembly